ncbi:proline dehydrogenase family protein [Escherichia coli]|nr:proline dehydrogenase family protein [Escherichia coli]
MGTTTMGVKLDDATRERIKSAATRIDRTPHWLIKQAIFSYLEQLENSDTLPELPALLSGAANESDEAPTPAEEPHQPFLDFAEQILPQSVSRAAITAAYRRPETEAVSMLLEQARLPQPVAEQAHKLAYQLADKLRNQKNASGRAGMVQGLLQEFSLSSQEGVALMCLAEALLRIPDKATRDALIRDKISNGNWQSHIGRSPSLFVNAATWGLLFTGKLVSTHNEAILSRSLNRIIGKSGEPLIRKGVDMAMRLMGEQFVTGETIAEALANARKLEEKGFRYSYDMLGEAALTAADAQAYMVSYQQAIHAIGKASNGRGIYEGPGISIKLSALHPRYSRAQYDRVMEELYPRLKSLTLLARQYDIGINIDAEEADRLEISLDLLEKLCFEPELAGWNGIGFVIQAYQKRCPLVIDYLIDLATRSRRRLMIRLVKGAYWDSEIKRAQMDGLEGYPVYTRKVYTDVSYLACAKKLLAVPNLIYPQFATHNAHTLAAIYQLAGQNYYPGQYEFQCLHGMGEPLYEQVTGKVADGKLNRPCRIYAPVGTHETLLGNPGRLTTDIGPVIDSEAKANIERHIQTMRSKGRPVFQAVRENSEDAREWQSGTFVAPTLIELDDFAELQKEVFGPVLHVVRYNRNQLPELIEQINASGYGLTLGVHTRIDETIAQVTGSAHVGNLYVNRNMVGAVVGVQPFGGEGLSGTGPKAGGPLYLYRLLANRPESALAVTLARQDAEYPVDAQLKAALTQPLNALREWAANRPELQALCTQYGELAQAGTQRLLPGPTGERNTWTLLPRERVLCIADDEQDALTQLAAVLAVGSQVLWPDDALHRQLVKALPSAVSERIQLAKAENITAQPFDAVIFHGDSDQLRALCEAVAARDGAIVSVQGFARGESNILLERLYIERSLSVNTAAAGGNASLMTIG